MKPLLIIANFKSNKTLSEAKEWLQEISKFKSQISNLPNKEIIVCPSFVHLPIFNSFIPEHKLPIRLGAQNISRLPGGSYTGEVNGSQIKDFADFVLIGHSERRGTFGEDESVIEEKLKMAREYNLTPILCVQNENNKIPQEVSIVAYEPVLAIGSGNPDTPENAQNLAQKIKEQTKVHHVLYGGSVTPENVKSFTEMRDIDGVLVGHESLDPLEFLKIIENA